MTTESVTVARRQVRRMAPRSGLTTFFRRRGVIFTILDFVVIIAVWHIAVVNLELVNRVFLPAPVDVVAGFGQLAEAGALWSNMGYSASTWTIGFVLGAIVGVLIGLVVGSLTVAYKLVMPIMWAAWATPLIAIQPILGVWFGFGMTPNIVLVFLSTAIPMSLNTVAGVSGVNPSVLRAARVYGATPWQSYLKVRLPWTIPYIMGGFRLAIPTSLIGLLIGEMIGSPEGMGSIIVTSLARFRTNQAFSAILFFIVVSVVLVWVAEAVERKSGKWRQVESK